MDKISAERLNKSAYSAAGYNTDSEQEKVKFYKRSLEVADMTAYMAKMIVKLTETSCKDAALFTQQKEELID